jgi:hypothetical protein
MPPDLRITPAERHQHAEGKQLARWDIDAAAAQVVAEAVGRQQALDVLLVLWRRRMQSLDSRLPDGLLLNCQTSRGAGLGRGGRLARQG